MGAEVGGIDLYAAAEALGIKQEDNNLDTHKSANPQELENNSKALSLKVATDKLDTQNISITHRGAIEKELSGVSIKKLLEMFKNMPHSEKKVEFGKQIKRLRARVNNVPKRKKQVSRKELQTLNSSQKERQLKQLQKQLLNATKGGNVNQINYFKNAIRDLIGKNNSINNIRKPVIINTKIENINGRNTLDRINNREVRSVLKRIRKLPKQVKLHIKEASNNYKITVDEMIAIIGTESSGGLAMFDKRGVFNEKKVINSKVGAKGLTQVMGATLRGIKKRDHIVRSAEGLEQNIMAGGSYYKEMLDKYIGNKSLAIAAYNAGPGAVNKYNGVPPYKETKRQVRVFNKYLVELKKVDIERDILA